MGIKKKRRERLAKETESKWLKKVKEGGCQFKDGNNDNNRKVFFFLKKSDLIKDDMKKKNGEEKKRKLSLTIKTLNCREERISEMTFKQFCKTQTFQPESSSLQTAHNQ